MGLDEPVRATKRFQQKENKRSRQQRAVMLSAGVVKELRAYTGRRAKSQVKPLDKDQI